MSFARSVAWLLAVTVSAGAGDAAERERIRLADALTAASSAWKLQSGRIVLAADEVPGGFEPASPESWRLIDGRVFAQPGANDRWAVAAYTVPSGASGFYALEEGSLRRDSTDAGRVALRVWVHRASIAGEHAHQIAVTTSLEGGEDFDFDTFLGYLAAGDMCFIAIGPDGDPTGDRTEIQASLVRTSLIPVTAFPDDFADARAVDAPGGWSLASGIQARSAAARHLAWGRRAIVSMTLSANEGRESVAMFRVPNSGYYALHDAWLAAKGGRVEARVYVGRASSPHRIFVADPGAARTSLNVDVGYVEQGDTITLAFATAANAVGAASPAVEFGGAIVEWAPRRAPLRVRRSGDGLLDVFEPDAPRRAIDIPAARWIAVPATRNDATEAIRRALAEAQALAKNDAQGYAGVRLAAGQTYVVASAQTGGAVFALRDAQRIVFDGNGATLLVSSPELARREISLFSVQNSRAIALADFTVTATSVPFTIGEVLAVAPPNANTQTVTFRVAPGALDPRGDISRSGEASGYPYDPLFPGRITLGGWSSYPGRGNPPLQPTSEAGVFGHTVTRTGNSIRVGDKWLVKNKRGGVIYLAVRSSENVTLSGVTGLASGGGHLRFSSASGVNLLGCRFEPDGENWISSSADSVHGRSREGPWIENTLIRGVCEDVMNTYGQSMVVVADDNATDAVISLRMFEGSVESTRPPVLRMPSSESALPGDQLVFFNPKSGNVLGYANVQAIANGRVTLSRPVAGIDTWESGDGRSATMVYNTRVAARFFIRDSRIMDSMRFAIYIKARDSVIFHSQFEGLSAPAIFATNEPEWPEGPPATHLWVQGCVFSQNNQGYMSRHRAFLVADPADISIYTRRLRDPAEPAGYLAHLTRGQFANSHVKLVGNVFHEWRGLGIAVRNSRNALIRDNLFLRPVEDTAMRATLAKDPALGRDGRGRFAPIFLGSVNGGRLAGNQAWGLPDGDQIIVRDADATNLVERDNVAPPLSGVGPEVALSFSEWFGPTSREAAAVGTARDQVELRGAVHRPGRLGSGLFFDGKGDPAVLAASTDQGARPAAQMSVALWVYPELGGDATHVIHAHGDARRGLVIAIDRGRFVAGLWQDQQGAWLDLGAATTGRWQHVALVYDGGAASLHGFIDGLEIAASRQGLPARLEALEGNASFGSALNAMRLGRDRVNAAGSGTFHGGVDEYFRFSRALDAAEVALLALRRPW